MAGDFYQRLGAAVVAIGGADSKILLYSEVEDGAISADVMFQRPNEPLVHFRFAPESLQDLIYSFWESGENHVAARSWVALRFVVHAGSFKADLIYPDQLNLDQDYSERRPAVIEDCFPGLKVDYSRARD